jgi:hypothetical protein
MITEVPKALYKYLKREHAEDILKNGTIRIGTLYEYRNIEDIERKDAKEGVQSRFTEISSPIKATKKEHLPGLFKNFFSMKGGTANILSGSLDKIDIFVDVYMYCMSEIYCETLMKDFGSDACIKIENPIKFISAITDHIREFTFREPFGGKCVYMDRRQKYKYPNKIPPCLIKETRYKHQQEFRVMWYPNDGRHKNPISKIWLLNTGQANVINKNTFWQPRLQKKENPIKAETIKCKEATKYCSLILI